MAGAEVERHNVKALWEPRSCGNLRGIGKDAVSKGKHNEKPLGSWRRGRQPPTVCQGTANNRCQRARETEGQRGHPGG